MELIYEGLDSLEEAILRQSSDFSYITLIDRCPDARETQLSRIEFSTEELAPYLSTDEDQDDATIELDDDDESAPPSISKSPVARAFRQGNPPSEEPEHRALLEGVCRWIRANVALNMVGLRSRSFRCRLYAAKGTKALLTASFTATNPAEEPPASATNRPGMALRAIVPYAGAGQTGVQAYPDESFVAHDVLVNAAVANQNLGAGYGTFSELLLETVKGMQEAMSNANRDLSSQLSASREYQTALLTALMERSRLEQESGVRGLEFQAQQQRTALAREAIDQFGNTAQMLLLSRMGHPLVTTLSQALQTSPRLAQVLGQPDVQKLLADPNALEALAVMLEGAVEQLHPPRMQTQWGRVGQQNQVQGNSMQAGAPIFGGHPVGAAPTAWGVAPAQMAGPPGAPPVPHSQAAQPQQVQTMPSGRGQPSPGNGVGLRVGHLPGYQAVMTDNGSRQANPAQPGQQQGQAPGGLAGPAPQPGLGPGGAPNSVSPVPLA